MSSQELKNNLALGQGLDRPLNLACRRAGTCDSDNYRKPKIHRRMCRHHVADHSAIGRARTEQQDYPEMTGNLW